MIDVKKVRKDFPILKRKINGKPFVYLNNAATTQKPIQVIDAVADFYRNHNSSVDRGLSTISAEAIDMYDNARKKVAGFVNAEKENLVFTKNTTEAINLVAYSLAFSALGKGDEVVLSKMEHHSNLVPWQQLAKLRGFKVKFVGLKEHGELSLQEFEKTVSDKTKVVGIVHASNVLGTINPVREIIEIGHRHGALVLVDGAQSAPSIEVDIKRMGADFLALSGHKMLGPTGIGALYARQELLEEMPPFLFGGGMISEVFLDKSSWRKPPAKFEAGTPNAAAAVGFAEAVKYLQKLGMKNVALHESKLTKYALDMLHSIRGIKIYGPDAQKRIGIIAFNVGRIHPHDIASVLDEHGIAIRAGDHCAQPLMRELGIIGTARASFYVYNSKEEVDALEGALVKAQKLLG